MRETVALLGEVIRREVGDAGYRRIENVRARMAATRDADRGTVIAVLRELHREFAGLGPGERREIALAFTLMLELMNACENAFCSLRFRRTRRRGPERPLSGRPDLIIYVLTAHPTEARSPRNIQVFHRIQEVLVRALETPESAMPASLSQELRHWLEVAWRTPAIRSHKPRVRDEAEHVYSTLLDDGALGAFLAAGRELAPVYARSWVGGDKDGHPGVDEHVLLESLQLSRGMIAAWTRRRLDEVSETSCLLRSSRLEALRRAAATAVRAATRLSEGDHLRVREARTRLHSLIRGYEDEVGALHPALADLRQLLRVFPAFVVPLELRESSDILVSSPDGKGLAILRMLSALHRLAGEADPRWYARGFIISMASSLRHIRIAAALVCKAFGGLRIPVIPLFEQSAALDDAVGIVRAMLDDRAIRSAVDRHWGGKLEIMLGYSDSAKESGVLPSRLKIASAMHAVDRLCGSRGVTPIFFQGSGGSVDRGGGTIEEQTSGWSPGALRNYKVTIQGEVVERSLASPEITRRQIERIVESAGRWRDARLRRAAPRPALAAFAKRVAGHYGARIHDPAFLRLIEHATPYPSLDALKIGSRPVRRATALEVKSLRAIPWVLCWTQTRVLFPTWWGVGSAWSEASARERRELRRAFSGPDADPVFATFVRALGFTLTKTELPVWRIYLENSALTGPEIEEGWNSFVAEHDRALAFAHTLLGRGLMGRRPWLGESIRLRSPMIHPLNVLQTIALREHDPDLLRLTMLGTSSGMMSTG